MADTSTALAVIPSNGVDTYRMSTDAAHICGAIVKQTAKDIQGRKYVQVEGWQAIAVAHGCAASSCNVERVEGGFKAVGQVRRMDTGQVIAEAEGFVGEDEPVWFGGEGISYGKKKIYQKRPDYAIRAMAQTRAISRACRSAFAHVVVMIDASLATTPAEEMPWDEGGPRSGDDWGAIAREAQQDGLVKGDGRSQYQVDKLKTARAAGWKVTNKTDKGKVDQIFGYLDMAENADDIGAILNKNVSVIEGSGKADEINASATRILAWFEKQAAGGKVAA